MEMFKTDQKLESIHDELMKHLKSTSSVTIEGDNSIRFYIPENGHNSWWFNDLVEVIARKIADGDIEMVKFCMKNNVDLFDVSIKKSINPNP